MSDSNSELPAAFKACFSRFSSTLDEIAKEFLYGHFPDLNEKEYIICHILASAYHDIDWGNYNYVIDVATHYYHEIFKDQKDIESTIQELVDKGIIQIIPMGEKEELRLKDDVQNDLVYAWRKEFGSAVEAAVASTNAMSQSE